MGWTVNALKEVVMIAELWRHGARTPSTNKLGLKYVDEEGKGHLTGNGVRMHYLLGSQIRSNYKDLFFRGSQSGNVSLVYSSDVERTFLSARAHLMGLFPIQSEEHMIFTIQRSNDSLFVSGRKYSCPNQFEISHKNTSRLMREYFPSIEKLAMKIGEFYPAEKYFQKKKFSLKSLRMLANELIYASSYYGRLMNNIDDDMMTGLKAVKGLYFIANKFSEDNLIKEYTTGISTNIISVFTSKIEQGKYSNIKFLGFSGHDKNLLPFMLKLRLTSLECLKFGAEGTKLKGCNLFPEVASNLIWELSKMKNEYYVRILYNGKVVRASCSNPEDRDYCKYDDFKSMMYSSFILETNTMIRLCRHKEIRANPMNKWFWVSMILFSIIIALQSMLFFFYGSLKSKNKDEDIFYLARI